MFTRLMLLSLALLTAACSGGDSGGGAYLLETILARQIQDGDLLIYEYSQEGEDSFAGLAPRFDGQKTVLAESVETLVLDGRAKPNHRRIVLKTAISADDRSPDEATEILVQDPADSLGLLATSDGCAIDEEQFDNDQAPAILPGAYGVGGTISSAAFFTCANGDTFLVSGRFAVQGIEFVETPFGRFETYRITYDRSIQITADDPPSRESSGTYWVYPPLGIVRELGSTETVGSTSTTRINFSASLVDTNISF